MMGRVILVVAIMLSCTIAVVSTSAQDLTERNEWMTVGSLHSWYSNIGCEREEGRIGTGSQQDGLQWPALYRNQDMAAAKGLWLGVTNYTDQNGSTYPFKVVHAGPRVRGLGAGPEGGFFPTKFEVVNRFDQPSVFVDGAPSASRVVDIDRVDPTIKPDRMIINEVNTSIGVTMKRNILGFSQEFHDDYIIYEYEFKNTGNVDADEAIELPNQTITGFYAFFQYRYAVCKEGATAMGNSARWGINTMNDTRGDGVRPDPPGESVRAQYAWHGKYPPWTRFVDNIGAPIFDGNTLDRADSVGRLGAAQFVGVVTIHADRSATDRTDDPSQPRTTTYKGSDDPLNSRNDQFSNAGMAAEYRWMSEGHANPRHADLVQPDGRFTEPTGDPSLGTSGGWSSANGYGPYTLAPGQSIRIILAEAAGGLSRAKQVSVGQRFKAGTINNRSKNDSVFSGRDSLFQAFRRAIANYRASYNYVQAPMPPATFDVKSGGEKLSLAWTLYNDSDPNLAGFRVYRTTGRYDADTIRLLSTLPRTARSYVDTTAIRGIGYYYWMEAFSPPTTAASSDSTPSGVSLVSNRLYSQAYDPAFLLDPGGPPIVGVVPDNLSAIRIVPNPFVNGSEFRINRGAGTQINEIQFRNVPAGCKVSIYTELGELIRELYEERGSGTVQWNSLTSSGQMIVSGLYIVVFEDTRAGGKSIQKLVVIR
jgi:hypothetical protein